jgi:maleylacetoacetate isomerase
MSQSTGKTLPGVTGPLTLYHYWRSTSSWRVRWALGFKGVEVKYVSVNLLNDESVSPEHLKRNPMGYVPVLEVPTRENGSEKKHLLTESTSIIEWMEELLPTPALLPQASFDRAKVRTLCELINAGTQPLVNLTVNEKLSDDPEERKRWNVFWIRRGFHAYEKLVQDCAGEFAFGNSLTLADIYLIPQVYAGLRNGMDMAEFPTISRINTNALKTPSGIASHPDRFKPEGA